MRTRQLKSQTKEWRTHTHTHIHMHTLKVAMLAVRCKVFGWNFKSQMGTIWGSFGEDFSTWQAKN